MDLSVGSSASPSGEPNGGEATHPIDRPSAGARRRVLIVAFRFPPVGGGGVQRIVGMTKYLPGYGWEPHILTGCVPKSGTLTDLTLASKIPEGVAVTRVRPVGGGRLATLLAKIRRRSRVARAITLTLPFMESGWIPRGVQAGLRLLAENRVHVIYSSAYPMGSHVIALLLKWATGVPWIADYRDEWSSRSLLTWPSPAHRAFARRLDRIVTRFANRVVTTSPCHTASLRNNFPSSDPSKYVTIMNGFDEDDFSVDVDPVSLPRGDRFELAHVGSLSALRHPDGLFRALQMLIDSGRIPAERITVSFIGRTAPLNAIELEKRGVLKIRGYVPHAEAVQAMKRADALLLINGEATNILAKTFEYLAAARPIIALVPAGPTAELVERANAGSVADPHDADAIAQLLERSYGLWLRGSLTSRVDQDILKLYSRREATRQLAGLFAGVAPSPSRSARRVPAEVRSG